MGVVLWNEEGAKHCHKFFMGNVRQRVVIDDGPLVSVNYGHR